jgi:hypothetical protein
LQPVATPTSQPSSSPSTALQIQIIVSVSQVSNY